MRRAAILAAALCACHAIDAAAQYGGGGRHRGGMQGDSQQQSESKKCSEMPDDPFAALERELPSLALDIGLTGAQVESWSRFQRDVRDIAELGRTRRRHFMGIRESGPDAPPTAIALVAMLSDDDRQRADATRALQDHLAKLYALLSDAQKRVLDKRLVLSQTDPLGR